MSTISNQNEVHPIIFLERPVVGMTSPEFQEFAKEVIAAIGRSTRRLFKATTVLMLKALHFINRKMNEGAEIHNRSTASIDDRYSRNWYYIRSLM